MEEMGALIGILFWIVIAVILVYLIIRRIGIKQNEDFEDRDN